MVNKNCCIMCGNPINLDDYIPHLEIPKLMKKEGICYKCAFWLKRLEYDQHLESNKMALVDNDYHHWVIKVPGQVITVPVGGNGVYHSRLNNMTYALAMDNDKFYILETNNLTHQGQIPEHLRRLFKVNCLFLTPSEYKQLQDRRQPLTSEIIKNSILNNKFSI